MARLDDPDCDIGLWRVAWDGDEVVGSVLNAIYRLDNERLGVSRGWLDHVSVRRRWRGLGVAKALCAASFRALAGAWDRGGVARRRRVEPDRRAPAVRGPRVRGRPALVRATRGRWTGRRPRAGSRTSSRAARRRCAIRRQGGRFHPCAGRSPRRSSRSPPRRRSARCSAAPGGSAAAASSGRLAARVAVDVVGAAPPRRRRLPRRRRSRARRPHRAHRQPPSPPPRRRPCPTSP